MFAPQSFFSKYGPGQWTRKANLDVIFVVGKFNVRLDVKNLVGVSRKLGL
jgi:hypothetical protein